jgi:DeoR/GlpR family transcriptional regulator of sugar metabolism
MKGHLFPEERLAQIVTIVKENGRVTVPELCAHFGVSRPTIRNDLRELEQQGLIRRTHGGALVSGGGQQEVEISFHTRARLQTQEKSRIGQRAASLVGDRSVVALDASTTALEVARRIKDRRELTVVTNGLRIALEFADSPHITVVVPGGFLRCDSLSLVGQLSAECLAGMKVQRAFFGAEGVTLDDGLTDVNSYEVQTKRAMARVAQEVIAIVDHTKWGRVSFAAFAALEEVNTIISDDRAPTDMVDACRERGVEVILV